MSGSYPDGVNQAIFDAYWNDKLDDAIENESPLDELIDFEPPHQSGCICADCSGAELTVDND